jgi:Ca-activated chloride channel family protein
MTFWRKAIRKQPLSFIPGIIILIILLASVVTVSAGNHSNSMMFIFDASGSMWGQVKGIAKIQIAKEVLTDMIMNLPEGINVGIVAYGHRKKGDCNDVEELIPLSVLNKEKLINTIKAINPKGKTPITLSIQTTADNLKAVQEETTIILVSDGKETCGGDPCELVRKLKESGNRFVMYVIGFDVSGEEKKQLECIAKAGGGAYYEANDAADFKAAAKNVVDDTGRWGFFKITAIKNGKPYNPWVEISITGEKKNFTNGPVESKKREPGKRTFRLPPGVYDIKIIDNKTPKQPFVSFPVIQINEGQTVEKTADFTGGTLKITTLINGNPFNASVIISTPDKKQYCSHWTSNGIKTFDLPPGTYTVKVVNHTIPVIQPAETFTGVRIGAGQTVEKTSDFPVGFLKVTASKAGKPYNTPVDLYTSDGKKYYTHWTSGGVRVFSLLPGKYDANVLDIQEQGKMETFTGIQVEKGKTASIEAAF